MDYTLLNTVANGNPPAAPGLTTATSGGSVAAGTYGVQVTYVFAVGETVSSAPATIVTTGSTSTLTIASPAAVAGATGWYAYVTQAGGNSYTRQQAANSPTAIGTNLTLTAPPTSNGAAAPASNGTGATQDFGAGNTMNRVAAEMTCDAGVTAATVTIQGSADGTTFVPLLTFTNGLRAAGVWFKAGSNYRAFNAVLSSYAGSGGVYVHAEFRGGAAGGSAGSSVGAF